MSSSVYISNDISEPIVAQQEFTNNFNPERPQQSMSSYSRIMHEHTKRQLTTAANSARRRSQGHTSETSLSSTSSVSSTDS